MKTVVGVDLSLTATGVAKILVEEAPAQYLISTIASKPAHTKPSLLDRLTRLQAITVRIVDDQCHDADLVVIEGPSFNSRNGQAHDRAGLWWMVVNELTLAGVEVAVCPPTSRMKYATGKGNAQKDVVLAAAVRRYPEAAISNNNEADAFVMAAMGARYLGAEVEPSLPLTHLTAMGGVEWPRTQGVTP